MAKSEALVMLAQLSRQIERRRERGKQQAEANDVDELVAAAAGPDRVADESAMAVSTVMFP